MKKKGLQTFLTGMILSSMLLSGCGTSAGDFADDYFSEVAKILNTSGSESNKTQVQELVDKEVVQIDSPEKFDLDNDGNYSFQAVEGAAQYYIYLCDEAATEDTDDYLYACQVDAGAEESITGKIPFEYKYGRYQAKVFAVSGDNTFSKANVLSYEHSGDIATPRVAYLWDGKGTVLFDVVNIPAYEYTICPDVEVTLKDLASGSETVVTMDGLSESDYMEAQVPAGEYRITARGVTDSEFVMNKTTDTYVIAEDVTLGTEEQQTADYETRATYTAVAMFRLDFTTTFDTNEAVISYTWANVLNAEFSRDAERENDWTEYYYVGNGTGDDGLYAEIAFKADGTCRMIARGGPYGGTMGGDRIADTGSDGYEWVAANGSWSIDSNGVITFTISG